MIAKFIDDFIEEYGEPTHFVSANPEILNRLRGTVPEVFLNYWERFGFSVFQNGLFQFVNPEIYRVSLDDWTRDTELEGRDGYHVIAMSAFGEFLIWGNKNGRDIVLNLLSDATILSRENDSRDISNGDENKPAEYMLFDFDGESVEINDDNGPMFERAVEKLGPLGPDQMYGLVPAVPLGGQIALDNLQIVSAPEYMSLCASLSERPVLGFNDLVQRAFGAGAVDAANKALDGQ